MQTEAGPAAPPAASVSASETADEVTRLSPVARRARLGVVLLVFVLLGWGSWRATDDAFPVGPFVMFAFTTPPDGDVRSAAVEAVDDAGRRAPVELEPETVGLRRAEMEGQIGRVVEQPHLLGALAVAHHRLQPGAPQWQQVDLVEHHVQLRGGRVQSESAVVLASWHR
ncbi:MAG: hypothetical protein QOG60_2723 [Frankiaceae bacterium]|nr:hypothetical protein [Frankiaceae bacterium]MDQ1673976.1 hypothetical protein [Frankiaceae bacterium]